MPGLLFNTAQGGWINEHAERLAEALHDWDPALELTWIPERARTAEDTMPYKIVHRPQGYQPYDVCLLSEEEIKDTKAVMTALYIMRSDAQDPDAAINKLKELREAAENYEKEQRRGAAFDVARFMLTTPLHTFRLSKDKVIRS